MIFNIGATVIPKYSLKPFLNGESSELLEKSMPCLPLQHGILMKMNCGLAEIVSEKSLCTTAGTREFCFSVRS